MNLSDILREVTAKNLKEWHPSEEEVITRQIVRDILIEVRKKAEEGVREVNISHLLPVSQPRYEDILNELSSRGFYVSIRNGERVVGIYIVY